MAFRKPVFGKYDAVRGQHANPKSRSMAARKLVERFHSSLHMVPEIKDEFGRFVDLLSVNGFCREDFGQHFVDAYNEEQYRRYDDLIVHGKCQRCGVAVQDVLKARSGCGLAPRVLWIAG